MTDYGQWVLFTEQLPGAQPCTTLFTCVWLPFGPHDDPVLDPMIQMRKLRHKVSSLARAAQLVR